MKYKTNTKKLWQTINKVIGQTNDKTTVIDRLKVDNITKYEPTSIANELGNYFSSVGKNFANKIKHPQNSITHYLDKIKRNDKSLYMKPATQTEISNIIDNLPNKTSSSHDSITNVLLKKIKSSILAPLTEIFNDSLTQGDFPDPMKLQEVIPLYKGKSREVGSNYRPISLLLTISKILEKIVYKRVYSFLTDTNQIYQSQYGFRKRHSCEHAELTGEILKNIENKKLTATIFLDLSKAFDTLEHSTLLDKLEIYGIRGVPLDWFRNYLTDRKLRVKCTTSKCNPPTRSDIFDIEYGTAQGSCLGPLLFLNFCNDLNLNLMFLHCIQFANDTTLYLGHHDIKFLNFCIKHDLTILQDWFRANKLTLNVEKSCCILFGQKNQNTFNQTPFVAKLGKQDIPLVEFTKFLGVWIDKNLSWKEHYNKLTLKLRSKIGLLHKSKNFLTIECRRNIYYAQIHSNLTYSLVIWGNMLDQTLATKLNKLQNKCIKAIDPRQETAKTKKDQNILSVCHLIQLENCKIWQKHKLNLLPDRLSENMTKDQHKSCLVKNHRYNTRRHTQLNIPKAQYKLYRSSFLVKGLVTYDRLPIELKQELNLHTFCRKTKENFLGQ